LEKLFIIFHDKSGRLAPTCDYCIAGYPKPIYSSGVSGRVNYDLDERTSACHSYLERLAPTVSYIDTWTVPPYQSDMEELSPTPPQILGRADPHLVGLSKRSPPSFYLYWMVAPIPVLISKAVLVVLPSLISGRAGPNVTKGSLPVLTAEAVLGVRGKFSRPDLVCETSLCVDLLLEYTFLSRNKISNLNGLGHEIYFKYFDNI
jgi:hypothetical protein